MRLKVHGNPHSFPPPPKKNPTKNKNVFKTLKNYYRQVSIKPDKDLLIDFHGQDHHYLLLLLWKHMNHMCEVGTIGKIFDYQSEGPGLNLQPARGMNFERPSFATPR